MRNLMEWDGVTRVHLKRRVSAAVMVLDDFTGRPIRSGDLQVSAAEALSPPVRKQDGYFLFLDCAVPSLEITARAWAYHPATVRVDLAALPPLRPVVKLRLTPNRNYAVPRQTTCLEGTAPAGTKVRVFCENDPRPLRLLYDYSKKGEEGGRLIRLYAPAPEDMDGKQFVLLPKEEGPRSFFEVRETLDGEEGRYLLTAPLDRDRKKAGATILPVSEAAADAKGSFFLPLRALPVKEYRCRVLWTLPGENTEREQSLALEPGRVTRLDLE